MESSAVETNKDKEIKQSRVNTPANLVQIKPLYSPAGGETLSPTSSDRMVPPKRKNEHFPHLYNVANNVKTSTYNELSDKSNHVKNVNQITNGEYRYGPNNNNQQNMVPERDTGPSTVASTPVSAIGNLRVPTSGQNSKINGDLNTTGPSLKEESKVTNTGRPHHHVSVQELRIQVRMRS